MSSDPSLASQRYKLVFFTPPQYLAGIKDAVFATGAGSYPGKAGYTQCCFTTPGVGQFKPGLLAHPTIGSVNELQEVGEVKCEIVCLGQDVARNAVEALKRAHPYEQPAYEVYKMEPF